MGISRMKMTEVIVRSSGPILAKSGGCSSLCGFD